MWEQPVVEVFDLEVGSIFVVVVVPMVVVVVEGLGRSYFCTTGLDDF